ncbi:sugar ABC transporter permease [Planotetraspora sp. A-T 1434]|uniref:carbohydrate ABC transporter permease n=1 Tax=Planotetraspora sp. A-T 1434 TaxID=2979219 RepID=UPI0021C12A6A|nr:sugar ABC transporter permease [Planotetraspora sp. A-T 1434]MCT9931288.1 sugar ABC transporter permease [Planotetraspora sp. A-T 1434]
MTQPRKRHAAPYLFLAPYLIFLAVFGVAPAVYAVWVSFETPEAAFAGLANWTAVLADARLLPSVRNVGTYLGLWLPTMLVLVTGLSLLAHQRGGRLSAASRFAWYLPGAVTGAAAALLWLFMLSPGISPFSPLLRLAGVSSGTDLLSGQGLPVVLTVMATTVTAGGWIVVVYAALNTVPPEILEAARVDGATAWQVTRYIKLRHIRPQLSLMLISSFAYGTQIFVEPQVLRSAFTSQVSETWSVNQLAYFFATQRGNFGMAASLSLMLLGVGLLVAAIVIAKTDLYATGARKGAR